MLTDDAKAWIASALEAVETRLLTAFHQWASPMEARHRSHTAVLRAMDGEMDARVKKLATGPSQ
jgi:hypothetical protein